MKEFHTKAMNGTAMHASVHTALSTTQEKIFGSVSHSSTILLGRTYSI
jgi:hypothetical protein